MSRTPAAALAAAAVAIATAVGLPASPAGAAPVAALERCQKNTSADLTTTVYQRGTVPEATFHKGFVDHEIFPGDVVRVTVTGQIRYDATHWAGPNGVGTPNSLGIRPHSSTATFRNNAFGWVGDERRTTALSTCTSAPTKEPTRLIYRIHDKDYSDNAGGFTITTMVWHAPGRIVIDDTEVTQGIQNRRGQVALIGDKRTYVRVYLHHLDDGLGPMSPVTATLTVPGVGTVNSSVYTYIATSTLGSHRRYLDDSFLFQLPAKAVGEGTRQAIVTVRPPEGRSGDWPVVRHVALRFGPRTSLHVIGVRYSYYNVPAALTTQLSSTQPGLTVRAGWWQARPISAWDQQRRFAQNALPVAGLSIADDAPPADEYSEWGTVWFNCQGAIDPANGRWYCGGYATAKAWVDSYADRLCPNGGCTVVLLQPEVANREEHGEYHRSTRGNAVINVQGERDLNAQGTTLAHEIGHSLGLLHTWRDKAYPRADGGLGPYVAIRYTPTFTVISGTDAAGNTTAWDLMSYSRPAFFSPYSYCKALDHMRGRHPVCAADLIG